MARTHLWWPFTPNNVVEAEVTTIDARSGESFLALDTRSRHTRVSSTDSSADAALVDDESGDLAPAYATAGAAEAAKQVNASGDESKGDVQSLRLQPLYDAAASWWTQVCAYSIFFLICQCQ